MALTQQQKAALALEVMNRVADMVEFRTEIVTDPALADVPLDQIAAQLSLWLKNLPGTDWDTRLPDPSIAWRILLPRTDAEGR